MNKLTTLLLLALATPLVACGTGLQVTTPDGFAQLEDQETYDYRATNAEGVVLAVRREDNAPYGDLSFWSSALDAHLQRGGYQAVEGKAITTASGTTGKQMRYTVERNGRQHVFWLTVFVTPTEVITIEAGGDVAFFDKVEKSVGATITKLDLG